MYKPFKKFFISFILLLILVLIIALLMGDYLIKNYPIKSPHISSEIKSIYIWHSQKKQCAKNPKFQGQKIVILSGSNTLFGVNAIDIEREIGIPVLNLGTHGGLYRIILEDTQDILKSGDIVILPLELLFYKKDFMLIKMDNSFAEYILSYAPNYYENLTLLNKLYCIRFYYYNYNKKYDYVVTINDFEGYPYSIKCWNKNGDVFCPRERKNTEIEPETFHITNDDMNYVLSKESSISKFINYAKQNNIQVIFMAPTLLNSTKDCNDYKKLYEIWDKLGVAYFKSVEDSMYPDSYFYDTQYHLNSKGAQVRTKQIIKYIKDYHILSEK